MTNEESIEVLKNDIEICTIQQKQACDMAIKALEQQNKSEILTGSESEDCISRADAIKIIKEHPSIVGNRSTIVQKIVDLPPVTPKARWIPVSERLPEKQDCYLVTTKWKGSYSGDVYIETDMAVYREKPKEWDCADVIAWMPLPQPYKAESEE